ncbi:RHS repeat protein, partial [bacterium]
YEYDSEQRIIEINPPSGDFIRVDYDDQTRNVTVSQGTSETTEAYDRQGRLQTRRTKIASGKYSYQQFEYDALSNISKISEKNLSASPTAFVTQTYDGMNRLTSIRTQDTLTEFIYDGPNVTKRVYDPNEIDTDYSYDAAGRLISVREPTGSVTNYSYDALDRLISVDQGSMERTFVYSSRGLLLSETHPESGKTTYTYDVLGRLKTKKLAGMTGTISYTYDARDRITKIDYPNDTDVKFFYDGTAVSGFNKTYVNPKSHLTGMVDATGTTLWTRFSDNGSPLARDIYWTGFTNPVSLTYTYDTRGNLSSILYPSQQLMELQRNDANGVERIERQVGSQGTRILVNSIEYNAALLPSRMFFPNGIQLDVTSDARNRPRFIVAADRLRLEYQYSDRGLIDQMNFGRSTLGLKLRSYDYDSLGRLSEMDSSHAAESAGYQWDDYGNLTQKSKALSGNYTYFNNQISNVAYSASGGQIHANGRTLVYDDENRLKQVSGLGFNVTYLYDGNGNRVNSHDANSHSNRFFVYDEGNSLIAEFSQDSDGYLYVDREYVNGPSGTLVTLNYTEIPRGVTAYNLSDRVRIYWKPLSGCSTSGVHLYRSLVSGGPYELLTGDCLNTSNYYDDLNVSAGVRYFYVVKSVNNDGVEYSSSEIGHTFSTSTPNFDGPVVDYARVPAYYHLNDHLGSTRSITNQNGEEVGFFDYFPFGEPLSSQGCSPSSQRFT